MLFNSGAWGCCRGIDPFEDTESGDGVALVALVASCRGIDPIEDTESTSIERKLRQIGYVAGVSIRLRILKGAGLIIAK